MLKLSLIFDRNEATEGKAEWTQALRNFTESICNVSLLPISVHLGCTLESNERRLKKKNPRSWRHPPEQLEWMLWGWGVGSNGFWSSPVILMSPCAARVEKPLHTVCLFLARATCLLGTSIQTDLRGKIWEKQLYKSNKIVKGEKLRVRTQPGCLDSSSVSIHELCNEGQHSVYMSMS